MRKRTNQSLFLIVCFSFYAIICDGQRRSIIFKTEAGLTLSVGKEVDKEVLSNVNPLTVNYIDNLHYRFPGFRVRIAAMKPLTPSIAVGLRGGANVHYFEFNPYGDKLTYFSFPIQAAAEIALLHFNSRALFLLLGAGHRFRKADYPPIHNSGGMLLSTELSFGKKDKKSGFYYKAGFDYIKEKESLDFVPSTDYGQNETIGWHFHRKQAFVALGVNF